MALRHISKWQSFTIDTSDKFACHPSVSALTQRCHIDWSPNAALLHNKPPTILAALLTLSPPVNIDRRRDVNDRSS